jgi:hypothetical protein
MLEETPPREPIDVKADERKAAREGAAAKKAASRCTATTLRRYTRTYHGAHAEPFRPVHH